MTFDIEAGGRRFTLAVERADQDHRFRVRCGDQVVCLDAVATGPGTWSLIDLQTLRSFDVTVAIAPTGEGRVRVGGHTVPVVVNGRRTRHAGESSGAGEQRVLAPMPGKVLRVLVAPGDAVQPRQPLVVVEAMKMENELSVMRPGHVREVAVTEGASVEAGRLLLIVA